MKKSDGLFLCEAAMKEREASITIKNSFSMIKTLFVFLSNFSLDFQDITALDFYPCDIQSLVGYVSLQTMRMRQTLNFSEISLPNPFSLSSTFLSFPFHSPSYAHSQCRCSKYSNHSSSNKAVFTQNNCVLRSSFLFQIFNSTFFILFLFFCSYLHSSYNDIC